MPHIRIINAVDYNSLKDILLLKGSALFYTPPKGKKEISYLFREPEEILTASDKQTFKKIITRAEGLIKSGSSGYILADYEASYFFEKKLSEYLPRRKNPLVQIFLYDKNDVFQIPSEEINLFEDMSQRKYSLSEFHLNTTRKEYIRNVEEIRSLIKEGDTYQVNYTVKGKFSFSGDPLALLSVLLFNQSAPYTAFINTRSNYIVSLSPELFFSLKEDEIITKPMKGTLKRTDLISEDESRKDELRNSEKERSENLMIVDLLRNDLGRISGYGTVKTEKLFEVEKYESLYQMVSTIRGKLSPGIKLYDIFNNIFPCGSVTGAPKLRTMEIIKQIEKEERGIYTGTIGLLLPERKIFNVAIRTININKKTGEGEIGLGSGIVWDSLASEEYKEVILKSRFLTKSDHPFSLIETMLLKNGTYLFEEEHLARLEASAGFFIFNYMEKIIRRFLNSTAKQYPSGEFKVRLLLSKEGQIKMEVNEITPLTDKVKAAISEKRNNSGNKFLYHKTTNRNIYNSELRKYSRQGFFDVLFFNESDELCEGAISNVFLRKGSSWFTPPVSSGLLPGIYRKFLITHLEVNETKLYPEDLKAADEILLVNSIRGKVTVDELK